MVIQEFELAIAISYPVSMNLNLLESGNIGPVCTGECTTFKNLPNSYQIAKVVRY